MEEENICPDCGGDIRIRNPTGKCDHLYYPEYKKKEEEPPCSVARKRLYEDFFPYIKKLHERCDDMKKAQDKDRERIKELERAIKALKVRKGREKNSGEGLG